MNPDKLKKYIQLNDEIKELKQRQIELTLSKDELQDEIFTEMEESGISNMKMDGRTIYLHKQTWVRANDKTEACAYMKEHGLEDYVKEDFNTNSLSAYYREMEKSDEPLPDGFDKVFNVNPTFSVRVLKS